jgi:hypothetical protein
VHPWPNFPLDNPRTFYLKAFVANFYLFVKRKRHRIERELVLAYSRLFPARAGVVTKKSPLDYREKETTASAKVKVASCEFSAIESTRHDVQKRERE